MSKIHSPSTVVAEVLKLDFGLVGYLPLIIVYFEGNLRNLVVSSIKLLYRPDL